jgi:hypothetical protein
MGARQYWSAFGSPPVARRDGLAMSESRSIVDKFKSLAFGVDITG